jgi:polygalacturonase
MNRASIICCAFYLIALCAFAVGEADGTTINARDFGAKGDGVANDAPALNRAIAEAMRLGPGTTVLIPKGRYHLENASGCHLPIRDAHGLTIQGEPGTILSAQNPDDHIVKLASCTGTTLKQLILEQEKTYFTQGVIDAMASDGKSCEVTIDPRFPEPDALQLA